MIDSKLIDEIVQQVIARLMEDPAFRAASQNGYFSSLSASNPSGDIGLQTNLNVQRNLNLQTNQNLQTNHNLQTNQNLRTNQNLQANQHLQLNQNLHRNVDSQFNTVRRLPIRNTQPHLAGRPSVEKHFGRVLSEWDILQIHRSGGRAVSVQRKTIVTPLAKDRARDLSVEIIVNQT